MPDIIKVAEATAGRKVREFVMLDAAGNPILGLTNADISIWLIKDGIGAAGGGTSAEIDQAHAPGWYGYTPSAAELAAGGSYLLIASAAGSVTPPPLWPFKIIGNDVYAASATAPTNFSVLAITGAGEVTAGTVSDKTGYALTAAERTSIASSVWSNATRSLTTFGTLVADIWANVTRTLSDKTGFGLSSAERTAIRAEMEGAGTKLSTATTAAAAIQAKTDNLPASPAAVGSAMTLATGQSAAIADAILGRNLAGGADGGATVGAALKGEMTLTMTSADHTAALSIGGVQVVSGTYVRNSDGTLTITLA